MPPDAPPPPGKVPMTPQGQLKVAVLMVVCAIGFAAFGLFAFHIGTLNEALFWLVMMLFSLIALANALRKRQKIQQGGSVYYKKPPDNYHADRAIWTVGLIFGAVAAIAVTVMTSISQIRLGPQPYDPVSDGSLLFIWAILILFFWRTSSKRRLLWSRLPQANTTALHHRDFDLPPLTIPDLSAPTSSVFQLGAACCWLAGIKGIYSHGQLHVSHILRVVAASLLLGSLMALTYVALVAVLTRLNKKQARLRNKSAAFAEKDIWPPPPTRDHEDKTL